MTTFTVTSDTNIDLLTPKTGGDTYNMNGAVLTIDSDSRWSKNATSSTGPFGSMTVSTTLGGGIVIDGTKVWLLPYDNGAGVVPATGDTITGAGGCTGELIGVWTAINTTPTTAGSAMPATGFIKLKDKTTTFSDNEALTGTGMTADVNSSTGGYRGWIEIVGEELRAMSIPRLGSGLVCTGDWFYLDDTTGVAGQILQAPNSGGTNSYYPAVEIETGVGTGVYEAYPAILAAGSNAWSPTYMDTDARCKFVEMMSSGRFRIGSDGSSNVGYLPTAGCRVRIPNIIWMNATAAARNVNSVPHATLTTRYDFSTTSGGLINWDKVTGNFYMSFAQAYSVSLSNVHTLDAVVVNECGTEATLEKVIQGNYSHGTTSPFSSSANSSGISLSDCKFGKTFNSGTGYSAFITNCSGITITGGIYGMRSPKLSAAAYTIGLVGGSNATISNVTTIGGPLYVSTGFINVTIDGVVYADTYVGSTLGTNLTRTIYLTSAFNVLVENISLFPGISNIAPGQNLVYITACDNVTIRNIGTYASPLNTNSSNKTAYPVQDGGNNTNLSIKRVYTTGAGTSSFLFNRSSSKALVENVFCDYTLQQQLNEANLEIKGCSFSNFVNAIATIYGTHWYDFFDSTTTGGIALVCNEKTVEEPSASSYTITGGTPQFTSLNSVVMTSLSDEIIFEMQYFAIGHTAFQNSAPIITGTATGNLTLEYDININDGNGFTGSYKTLTGANLSAETIDPILGVKLRLKVSVNTAASNTLLRNVNILTSSTTTTQAYQYPLSTLDLTFSGLQTGSVVMVLEAGTENMLAKLTETAGIAIYTYDSSTAGDSVDYAILAPGYVYQRQSSQTLPSTNTTRTIVQQADYIYGSSSSALVSFNGVTKKITMNAAATALDVVGMYSDYIDWALTATNLKYNFAFDQAGGREIDSGAGTSIPAYVYLTNSWKIAPDEANHTLTVSGGVLLVSGGGDPFDDTAGAYTIRINYQQPVQAIAIASGGGGGASAADVWSYTTRTLSTGGVTAIQSGIATSAEIAALNNLSAAQVNAEVDTALADYDAPTKAELDTAIGTVTTNQGVINVGVQKASKLIPHSTDL